MSRSRLSVFFIDHDEEARVTQETILRTEGYEILSASDGLRGLEQLREQAPDLLIVGHKLGSIPATQLIRMVKIDASLFCVPVIAIVPDAHIEVRTDLQRAGADSVILLSASSQELVREVVRLIGRA